MKFLFAGLVSFGMGNGFWETLIYTALGGLLGMCVFYLGGKGLLEWFRTGGGPSSAGAGDAVPAVDPVLTRREAEILQLVAAGLSNKEIAARLVITEGTVKNHVHNSLEKLHLTNRVQAAAYAVRQGAPTHLPD